MYLIVQVRQKKKERESVKKSKKIISPHIMLTLLNPFCSLCTEDIWAQDLGWSLPQDTFVLLVLLGKDLNLLAAGRDKTTVKPKEEATGLEKSHRYAI